MTTMTQFTSAASCAAMQAVQSDKRFVASSVCMESVLSLITQSAYLPDGMEKLLSWGVEEIIVSGMSASGVSEVGRCVWVAMLRSQRCAVLVYFGFVMVMVVMMVVLVVVMVMMITMR